MVSKEVINDILTKSIELIGKCNDYPKAIALKYYKEHKDQFVTEDYTGVDSETIPSPQGYLQGLQSGLQSKVNYTSIERGVARCYSTNSYIPLNMYLNDVPNWEKESQLRVIAYDFGNGFVMPILDSPNNDGNGTWVDMSMPQQSEILSGMIDKSPRVARDCTVFRYGEIPLDIKVGEHGVMKGFQSTSYNEWVAFKDIAEGGTWILPNENRYKLTIHVMKGTKGMVLDKHTGCVDWQSELLLDKGMRYVVLDKNDDDMTAEILMY